MHKEILVTREEENEWEKLLAIREEEELRNEGLRKGQWTPEEDSKLSNYIANHGLGNWNSLARCAGLMRSGKSCRLRWLNYLRPDLRHGDFSLEEQLLILQLHFRWGNRWAKIAQELPGRTDNEIKNYWRTKVQKLAKRFHCDAYSPQFRLALLHTYMPRLVDQIRATERPQSTLGPFTQVRLGPELPFNEPNISNLGCSLDTSCIQTSMDLAAIRSIDLHVERNTLTDPYEAHISPDSSSSGNISDSMQIWEHNDDNMWELPLSDEDFNLIRSTFFDT